MKTHLVLDKLLLAINNVKETLSIPCDDVSSFEPSVSRYCGLRSLGIIQVPLYSRFQ